MCVWLLDPSIHSILHVLKHSFKEFIYSLRNCGEVLYVPDKTESICEPSVVPKSYHTNNWEAKAGEFPQLYNRLGHVMSPRSAWYSE